MLFSSQSFIFIFLPLVVFIYYLPFVSRSGLRQMYVLLISSLFFYGYWLPQHLPVFVGSILFNYVIIRKILGEKAKIALIGGIAFNLGLLIYYKYSGGSGGFGLVDEANRIPLGISFFTFQQIGVLLWVYYLRNDFKAGFFQYAAFVSFFPQLIAGPICKWEELGDQIRDGCKLMPSNLLLGAGLFVVGLFKKVVLGDSLGVIADKAFGAISSGQEITFLDSVGGASAFSLQIYFDFSGYSEMALGLALIFGMRLPVNFHTPLQAETMGEFWKRWHVSLSRFAFETVFLPLAKLVGIHSARFGSFGSSSLFGYGIPIFATFVVIGVWHGKGWNFFFYGVFHGVVIIFEFLTRGKHIWKSPSFLAVILRRSWVFGMLTLSLIVFRLETPSAYINLFESAANWEQPTAGFWSHRDVLLMGVTLCIVQFLPSVHSLFGGERVAIQTYPDGSSKGVSLRLGGYRTALAVSCLALMYFAANWMAYEAELRKFIYFDY